MYPLLAITHKIASQCKYLANLTAVLGQCARITDAQNHGQTACRTENIIKTTTKNCIDIKMKMLYHKVQECGIRAKIV